MRLIGWNIRAGGGIRATALATQLGRWAPDVVALCEFRATPPSAEVARALAAQGLAHQTSTADPRRPGVNALLIASRWPIRRRVARAWPCEPGRWLLAAVEAPRPFTVGHRPQVSVPRRGAAHGRALGRRPRRADRRYQLGPARPRRGADLPCRLQRTGGGMDRGSRPGGLARRLPPSPRRRACLHMVLAQRGQRLPPGSGLRQRRAPPRPRRRPLRLGPATPGPAAQLRPLRSRRAAPRLPPGRAPTMTPAP
jgi:Endonuclease/Exonuclease/phosphatase family